MSNLNTPRIHSSEPLTDEDFGKMPWKMPSGETIPEPDKWREWLDIGHQVVAYVCLIGISFAVGFLAGVNWRG
jgi:hypothetical protein